MKNPISSKVTWNLVLYVNQIQYLPIQRLLHQPHNLVLDLVKRLVNHILLLKIIQHIAAKLLTLLF